MRRSQLHCLRLTLQHYENFFVLGPLTPLRLVPHLSALYAFCRHADDLADEIQDRNLARSKLEGWEEELRRGLDGGASHAIIRALTWTVERRRLPTQPLFDLISAFRQDLSRHSYSTFAELRDYTRRSADPVGRLVLRLHGYDSAELDFLSDSICTGLQLANFCQDVGPDARRERLYIPLEECFLFEVDPAEILSCIPSPKLEKLLRFQIIRAYKHLQLGLPLAEKVQGKFRVSLRLFILGGLRILDALQKDPLSALHQRVSLASSQKVRILLRSLRPLGAERNAGHSPEKV